MRGEFYRRPLLTFLVFGFAMIMFVSFHIFTIKTFSTVPKANTRNVTNEFRIPTLDSVSTSAIQIGDPSLGSVLVSAGINHTLCPPHRKPPIVDDILCMSKLRFDDRYKNPCWHSAVDGSLKCLPYFMLIGMDKSGSTDLFDRILRHPEVVPNGGILGKETQWWSWHRYGFRYLQDNAPKSFLRNYIHLFDPMVHVLQNATYHNHVTGDGTPMDMWDFRGWPQIPQNARLQEPRILTPHLIRHLLPNVKLIVILRNPTDRLYSDYHFISSGSNKSPENFHKAVLNSIKTLDNCTTRAVLRSCLYNKTVHLQMGENNMVRVHVGYYVVFLKEWLKVFPRNQFLILSTEEYSKNIFAAMEKVFNFLNVTHVTPSDAQRLGITSTKRSYVTDRKRKTLPMKNSTREILDILYHPFNTELAEILQNPIFNWT